MQLPCGIFPLRYSFLKPNVPNKSALCLEHTDFRAPEDVRWLSGTTTSLQHSKMPKKKKTEKKKVTRSNNYRRQSLREITPPVQLNKTQTLNQSLKGSNGFQTEYFYKAA